MMTATDFKWINVAKEVAKLSTYHGTSIGVIAVYRGKIVSSGFNEEKTHPIQYDYNKFRFKNESLAKKHAEVSCLIRIKNLDINFSKLKLYIYRICNDEREHGIARPCASCMAMIRDLGIKNIYYSTDEKIVHEKIIY